MNAVRKLIVLVIALAALPVLAHDDENFDMGISQSDKAFFQEIQRAVASNDYTWLSKAVSYPLDVQLTNRVLHLADEADFRKNARTILTKQLRSIVKQQSVNSLFKNWQGVMVGRGQIWFTQIGEERGKDRPLIWVYKITAFNLDAPNNIRPKATDN